MNSIDINNNTDRLKELATNLYTPVQFLERQTKKDREYLELLKMPILIGMFSDEHTNSNTLFSNCWLDRKKENSGGNYTYYICFLAFKIKVENGMTLGDLAIKSGGYLEFINK